MQTDAISSSLRRVILIVAALNLAYFGVEFGVALAIGSVSLFADSIDFLEDASVNILIFLALGWSIRARAGMAMAAILLVPAAAMLWVLWQKFNAPVPPAPIPLSLAGAGALAVNLACAFLLARFRDHSGSLTPRGVPLGAQRCNRQCGDCRDRLCDGLHAVGLARRYRGRRHRDDERGRRPRSVGGGAG